MKKLIQPSEEVLERCRSVSRTHGFTQKLVGCAELMRNVAIRTIRKSSGWTTLNGADMLVVHYALVRMTRGLETGFKLAGVAVVTDAMLPLNDEQPRVDGQRPDHVEERAAPTPRPRKRKRDQSGRSR